MRSSSDTPGSEPRFGFLPYLLQVSVTQHPSVSFVQLSFGQATSRPQAHAASEGPQPSFWGYAGHWHPSERCFTPLPFVSFVPLHGSHIKHDALPETGHFSQNLCKTDHEERILNPITVMENSNTLWYVLWGKGRANLIALLTAY